MSDVRIIAADPFGLLMGREVERLGTQAVVTGADGLRAPGIERCSKVVLASGHPVPHLCRDVAASAFVHGLDWLPAIIEHPLLRVGPVSGHGRHGCFECSERRRRQHAASRDILEAVDAHYWNRNADWPPGYLPSTAAIAAALIVDLLTTPANAPDGSSRVLEVDLVSHRVSEGRVVGVHGCRRCSSGPPAADRSWKRLLDDLQTSGHR